MKVTVRYFGMLAEKTSANQEAVHLDGSSVLDLLEAVQRKYPELKEMQFQVAVDHEIAAMDKKISEESEIALLPPFAGG